ncbi:MAG: box helicase [Chitinophagaceae bacterium]|nr:box helicase [Chitinophagaceae bacterium]
MTFKDLKLIEPLLRALESEGYTEPTPIQEQAIPVILQQKDLQGCAQTGTGKTAAFALPILQMLIERGDWEHKGNVTTLILTPTRELAIQIEESFQTYGKNTDIKHVAVFGGVSQHQQVKSLRNGADVLIATPGRLMDLIHQKLLSLRHINMLVLDEADRMLDMGFIADVRKIVAMVPKERQTLFFSATMPDEIAHLAQSILNNPVKIAVTPVASTAEKIDQVVYHVKKEDKRSLLLHLLKNKDIESALVFTRTKHGADKVCKELLRANIKAEAIHGNKSQGARQSALQKFKDKSIRILVATDIAARGIDVDNLSHVFNFELPEVPETYVHRIGRTGRAGLNGSAISFCDYEEKSYLRAISLLISQNIPVVEEHPYHFAPPPPPPASAGGFSRGSKSFGPKNRRTFMQKA